MRRLGRRYCSPGTNSNPSSRSRSFSFDQSPSLTNTTEDPERPARPVRLSWLRLCEDELSLISANVVVI